MKKTVVFVLSILLLFSMSASVFAIAADAPKITGSEVKGAPGDTVTVSFSISGNTGFLGMQSEFVYDSNVLTLKSVNYTKLFGNGFADTKSENISDNPYSFNIDGMDASDANGQLVVLDYEIIKKAADGTYDVTMNISKFINGDAEKIAVDSAVAKITVEAPSTAHEHKWDEGKVTKEPTCGAEGEKTYECECGEKKIEKIPATGEHKFGDWVVVQEASEADGLKERECSVCHTKETEVIKGNGGLPPTESGTTTTKPTTTTEKDNGKTTTKPSNGGGIPRTGDAGVSLAVAAVVAAMSVAGVTIVMKKRNDD